MASKCCGLRLTKILLYIFQFLFVLTGLGICALAAWNFMLTYHFLRVLDSHTYSTAFYLFVATGLLVIFVFLLGSCAIPKRWTKLLFCYIVLLLAIFLFEILIGIFAFIFQDNIQDDLNLNYNTTILTSYKFDDSKTTSIDYIQTKLHCCGAKSYEDWKYSTWRQNATVINLVPDSCCITLADGCGVRDHPSNINQEGCMEYFVDNIKEYFWIIFIAVLGICVFHSIGIIIAVILFLKLESGKYEQDYSPRNGGTEALLSDDMQQHL